MQQFLGRYTSIIVTTVIFLLLVVGVLGVNFNLSFQTEANAEVVNIAGRQRMLSQRVAKSLSNVQARYLAGTSYEAQLKELDAASTLFNRTINAFQSGGLTQSTKSGESQLNAVSEGAGKDAVDQAMEIWQPLYSSIQDLLDSLSASSSGSIETSVANKLAASQAYADANINTLLKLMNDLTNYAESLANQAADNSRLIQTAGIIASLFCFAIIMYLIFGQLRRADEVAAIAREETQQIFSTVDQGLFLIGPDMSMGGEHSKALESIFSTSSFEGKDFKHFISGLVSTGDLEKVVRYLKLLFDPHKKQKLLSDLNPLNQLAIQVEENGQLRNKFLNFSFSRVMADGEIASILTSVSDITREVKLAKDLEAETQKNEQQLEMISALMGADAEILPGFIKKSGDIYHEINQELRNPANTSADLKAKADSIFALIHKVKGESAAFGLSFISETCHQFENQLELLTSKAIVSGDDFLSLTIMLEQLITTNEKIDSIHKTVLSGFGQEKSSKPTLEFDDTNQKLLDLADQIATRQNKKVQVSLAGFDSATIPSETKIDLISLTSQLLRNAIAHGIEAPQERVKKGKDQIGNVSLSLFNQGKDGLRLICEDDGSGIDFDKLAENAKAAGLIDASKPSQTSPGRIINLLLTNRLSSKDKADADSGRGVGLNVVGEIATKLGGKVALKTTPSEGTRFTIRFPKLTQVAKVA